MVMVSQERPRAKPGADPRVTTLDYTNAVIASVAKQSSGRRPVPLECFVAALLAKPVPTDVSLP